MTNLHSVDLAAAHQAELRRQASIARRQRALVAAVPRSRPRLRPVGWLRLRRPRRAFA